MAPRSAPDQSHSRDIRSLFIYERLISLNENVVKSGIPLDVIKKVAKSRYYDESAERNRSYLGLATSTIFLPFLFLVLPFFLTDVPYIDGMIKSAFGVKCVVPNNYLVWEATRPVTDCSMCSGVEDVLFLDNVTRQEFKDYAYSYRPIVVRGAASAWPAVRAFDYDFFKGLFHKMDGAYESVEEECQFLNFKSDFHSLREVFEMPKDRAFNAPGWKPWYIGWSNCHPEMLKVMRQYYSKPHFLPEDAEHSHIDFVFMGYQQGAFMHLDYISRLMWQAQLRGHKVWRLNPPPECENVCRSHQFKVNPGDILLLDTRQWYHDTYVLDGEFSLTVSSEYG